MPSVLPKAAQPSRSESVAKSAAPKGPDAWTKQLRDHFLGHAQRAETGCHLCQIRAFPGQKTSPVTLVNEIKDGATLPANFAFIQDSVLGDDVNLADEEACYGCTCEDVDDCMYSGCSCLDDMSEDDEDRHATGRSREESELDEDDPSVKYAKKFSGPQAWAKTRTRTIRRESHQLPPVIKAKVKKMSYHMRGVKRGLLTSRAMAREVTIYECHSKCHCSKDKCPNRVVGQGRTVPLQIFRTQDHRGWGLRTMADLKRGQFVDCYLGEIITPDEAEERREAASLAARKDVYLFALDKFSEPDDRVYEMDGEFRSGPTRFINHSCDPNLAIFAVVHAHANSHLHKLAFFATKDIDAGEEMTFDYVHGQPTIEVNAQDESLQKNMTKCLCGAAICRGFLW